METAVMEQEQVDTVRIPMSKAQFLDWSPNDGFLYEYNAGFAEQTSGMKNKKLYIVTNIQDKFRETQAYQDRSRLFEEADVWVSDAQKRIPDMALFTRQQIMEGANDYTPTPAFVVELISPGDKADKVEMKVIEYVKAGVQVIWHVFPALQMVRVFTSVNSNTTYFETDMVSAAPVLPDLQLTVNELFAR